MADANLTKLKQALDLDIAEENLRQAFLHSSYVNECEREELESNERLEFLGDAVIDLAISEYLFKRFRLSEGELTKMKSVVVSGPMLADHAKALMLHDCLMLGRGEEESGGRNRSSILSDAFEALVGVIFVQKGYREAARFVLRELKMEVEKALKGEHQRDYKTMLQEEAQRRSLRPAYTLVEAQGADHEKEFTVEVELDGVTGWGTGRRVKDAEQAAAKDLYRRLVG